MKRSDLFKLLARLGVASGMTLVGCNDLTTGVPIDPAQLLVTRVTYTYPTASGNIFGDTSAPQLCPGNMSNAKTKSLDPCDMANYSATASEGQIPAPAADYNDCCLDYYKDSFSTLANPAPPFSKEFRVVFNEVPTTMNGKPLETVQLSEAMPENPVYSLQSGVVGVSCDECSMSNGGDGLPTLSYVFDVDGSYYSSDPSGNQSGVQIPYGPAISVYTFAYNLPPFTMQPSPQGLEPGSTYHFSVNPTLTGSGGTAIGALTVQEKFLTTIHTAAFAVNTLGIGAPADTAPTGATVALTGLSDDGVITINVDAAVYDDLTPDNVIKATVDGVVVPAKIGIYTTDGKTCSAGQQNQIYIYPASGQWADPAGPHAKGTLSITDTGSIFALSWKSGVANGKGRASLTIPPITATLTGSLGAGDMTYTGVTASGVASKEDCAALGSTGADMSMADDLSKPADMSMALDMSKPADLSKTTDMAIKG